MHNNENRGQYLLRLCSMQSIEIIGEGKVNISSGNLDPLRIIHGPRDLKKRSL
jgi:hypothetical protein